MGVSEADVILYETHPQQHLAAQLKQVLLPRVEENQSPGGTVADIMSSPAITDRDDASLRELAQELLERKIKRSIIVDPEKHPLVIVSRIDIVKAFEHLGRGVRSFRLSASPCEGSGRCLGPARTNKKKFKNAGF
jgi:CBS-domain-containing membrane protein